MKKRKNISLIHQFYKELKLARKKDKSIITPFKHFFIYLQQNRLKRNRLTERVPWMTVPAVKFLDNYCKPNINILEFGSGASTLFFSNKGCRVFSIEHNKNWFLMMRELIEKNEITNISLKLFEPTTSDSYLKLISSKDSNYLERDYSNYVHSVKSFQDNFFDLIVIDGRVRVACFESSFSKLKDGGYIVFDNGDREEYLPALNQIKKFELLSEYTVAMYDLSFSQTNIYQIWK